MAAVPRCGCAQPLVELDDDRWINPAGDGPEVLAVDHAFAVLPPGLLVVRHRPAAGAHHLEIDAEQAPLFLFRQFNRQDRAKMIGDIKRPAAALQQLPIDQPRAVRCAEDVARVAVAVDEELRTLGID